MPLFTILKFIITKIYFKLNKIIYIAYNYKLLLKIKKLDFAF